MSRSFNGVESGRLGAAQNIATSTTSAASAAFAANTYQIRVCADVATRIRIGDGTPTAVAADTLVPASLPEYFTVTPGQKIAAILGTGTGNLSVTEMAG
ncbi:MAG: hypothetical protein IT537_24580 [Hyphomicrobiales bacterium]|nr:hypothetical protein [Hyphomicrobiales bacterium]